MKCDIAFKFGLQYAIRKALVSKGLEVNGKHQLLVYADDINLLGEDINNIKNNHRSSTRC
jgi:hypothetical protein